MCDVESYIYMPLLEELNYMPKHKYSYGPELRQHAYNIADHFNLVDKTLFQSKAISMDWDEKTNEWITKLEKTRKGKKSIITVRSRFAILAGGTAVNPKLPRLQDLNKFLGHTFHTSRWDWKYTGGTEENPTLSNLKDKRVAIIGTGATAIQVVPRLAAYAKQLYVFQRTPSAVDVRGQQETDSNWWQSMQKNGWQLERRKNFSGFVSNTEKQPDIDMVDDGWTKFISYAALTGNAKAPTKPEDVASYINMMNALDIIRSERVRSRVDEIVQDKSTAEKLKAWYPGWCKRPCFHDEYLQSFNSPNVTLIDTDGQGVEKVTENGLWFDGKEYPIDVLIFSTGYEIPLGVSPAGRSNIKVTGQNGQDLDKKWANGVATIHGVQSNGFPNLFWMGLVQTGATPNQTAMVDEIAKHVAIIVSEAGKRTNNSFTIQPTIEGEEEWTEKISSSSSAFSSMGSCPPSYFNGEGDLFRYAASSAEALKKLARGSYWPTGLYGFVQEIEKWRSNHMLEGFEVMAII